MSAATAGDTIQMHYKGTLADGTVFDSSEGRDPLEFELGAGQVISGLDVALAGMGVGDKKTITIAPENAYGAHHADRTGKVPRAQFPDDIALEPGTQLQMQTADGQAMPVVILETSDEDVTLDANHPLAGKTLTFAVEIVGITKA